MHCHSCGRCNERIIRRNRKRYTYTVSAAQNKRNGRFAHSGYHFSYVGTSQGTEISSGTGNDLGLKGSSLCTEHDDGGVVTHYGYGYFYADSNLGTTSIDTTRDFNDFRSALNEAAGAALKAQMPGYTFVAYETGSNMYLETSDANGTWQLVYTSGTVESVYNYTLCPFFADSMSLDSIYVDWYNSVTTNDPKPGTARNPYQIRSVTQLQYINWNYLELTTSYALSSNDVTTSRDRYGNTVYTVASRAYSFPYLTYATPQTSVAQIGKKDFQWVQNHDLDAAIENEMLKQPGRNFTPIGSMYDAQVLTSDSALPFIDFFSSS